VRLKIVRIVKQGNRVDKVYRGNKVVKNGMVGWKLIHYQIISKVK